MSHHEHKSILPGHWRLWHFIVLITLSTLALAGVCGHEFLGYDDGVNIYANPYVTNFSLANLLHFWRGPHASLYIPVTYNSWTFLGLLARVLNLDNAGQPDPSVFHTANLLVHLSTALLVFFLLRRLVKKDWPACLAALFFALHPLQIEAVAWATGFKDLLCGFFSLAAIWCYLVYGDTHPGRKRTVTYLAMVLTFGLAMLAKPSAVTVPLIMGLIAWLHNGRSRRRIAMEILPLLALALPVVWITQGAQPGGELGFLPAYWQRFLVAGDAISFYFYKLILPVGLGPDYGRTPEMVLGHWWVFLTGLAPWLLLAGLLWKKRGAWFLAAGISVFFLLPVLGMVPFKFQVVSTVADRYFYVAMLGPALALARILTLYPSRRVVTAALVLITILGGISVFQVSHWQNAFTFYTHAIKINPDSWFAHNNLGLAFARNGKYPEAIFHYRKSLTIMPGYDSALNNVGVAYWETGRLAEAETMFEKAIASRADYVEAYDNLANLYKELHRNREAARLFAKALQLRPDFIKSYYGLAALAIDENRKDEAAGWLQKILAIDPNAAEALNNLGAISKEKNQITEAERYYRRAIEAQPDFAEAYNNLATLYYDLKEEDKAIPLYQKAVELSPAQPGPYNNLARVYFESGRFDEAAELLLKLIDRQPDFAQGYNNLSMVYLRLRQYDKAIFYADRAAALGWVDPAQLTAVKPYRK